MTALVRNIVKGVFGGLSLLAMAGSARKKALHDFIVGTTVQAKDAHTARLRNFIKLPARRAAG